MLRLLIAVFALLLLALPASSDLRGHGGTVRALDISTDGTQALSGSFDNSVIRWDLTTSTARAVMRFHDGPVNAVLLLPDGRAATAGDDGRIGIWGASSDAPELVLNGHDGKVTTLAVSPDGTLIASGAWDRTVGLWTLATAQGRVLLRHADNVNAVAFTADGRGVVSAGYDRTVRITPIAGSEQPLIATLPAVVNALRVAPDGEIVAAGADGHLYLIGPDGARRRDLAVFDGAIVALAISRDGRWLAASGLGGIVAIVERASGNRVLDLAGTRFSVWAVAFSPDAETLYTGGADRTIRQWDVRSGAPQEPPVNGRDPDAALLASNERGAQVFRACAACHGLTAQSSSRAGPTLHGVFGRHIGSLPGYAYSAALTRLDIVWSADTIARMFEVGPATFTPGTRMPEQTISDAGDRRALVEWLERVTR